MCVLFRLSKSCVFLGYLGKIIFLGYLGRVFYSYQRKTLLGGEKGQGRCFSEGMNRQNDITYKCIQHCCHPLCMCSNMNLGIRSPKGRLQSETLFVVTIIS